MSSTVGEYTDATTRGGRQPRFQWQRARSSGHGPGLRIPERKQVNHYQAFIVASSLWPFRWWNLRRSSRTVRPVQAPEGD
jgi:hypothetical protein